MRFVILGLLLGGPLSLYDLHKHFTGGISLFYAASFGSIQRALKQVHADGWATVEEPTGSRRRKKLYAVTELGREKWREWMMAPPTGSDAESILLAKVYHLGRLPANERTRCLAVLRARMREDAHALEALAASLDSTEVPRGLREIYRYQRATLDYGIRSHSLALEWLDELQHDRHELSPAEAAAGSSRARNDR